MQWNEITVTKKYFSYPDSFSEIKLTFGAEVNQDRQFLSTIVETKGS